MKQTGSLGNQIEINFLKIKLKSKIIKSDAFKNGALNSMQQRPHSGDSITKCFF